MRRIWSSVLVAPLAAASACTTSTQTPSARPTVTVTRTVTASPSTLCLPDSKRGNGKLVAEKNGAWITEPVPTKAGDGFRVGVHAVNCGKYPASFRIDFRVMGEEGYLATVTEDTGAIDPGATFSRSMVARDPGWGPGIPQDVTASIAGVTRTVQ